MSTLGRVLKGIILGGGALFVLLLLAIPLSLLGFASYDPLDVYRAEGDIAIVPIEGPIMDSQEVIDVLHVLSDNDSVKGVLLRIDSPGGGVAASQEIYSEVKKLSKRKLVYVSMGSVAASGGYYIACAATRIFANAGTVTGSIGVLMENVDASELLSRLYLKNQTMVSGAMKDAGSPLRPMTDGERAYFKDLLQEMHEQFIAAIAEGRKLDLAVVRALADGRVFTGARAQTEKLVDLLGTYYDARDALAKDLKLDDARYLMPDPMTDSPAWLSFFGLSSVHIKTIHQVLNQLLDGVRMTQTRAQFIY